MHWYGRASGAVVLTLLLVALAKPAHAQTAAVCGTVNDKIAQLEQPINELRELLQGFANTIALLESSSAQLPPNLSLGAYASDEEFRAKLASLRSQAAANEPELRRLRGLRVRFCSGQMASTPSAGLTAPTGTSIPRYQSGSPQTAHRSPSVVSPRRGVRSASSGSMRIASFKSNKKYGKSSFKRASNKQTARSNKRTSSGGKSRSAGGRKRGGLCPPPC